MTQESQNLEWKESWKDDHLRWVCGFANTRGGTLVIGRNDKGQTVGLKAARKLLEDLPNKIRDLLGIVVEVNLVADGALETLEILVEPHSHPISYRGHYYQRSGSTLQELKGTALDRFLLGRQGRTWDSVPVPQLKFEELSDQAIRAFRSLASRSGRLDEAALAEANEGLLDKLRLREGDNLLRAAALLFHPEPDRFFTGASVKIAYFRSASELSYQDELHGDLFSQVRNTIDLLRTKYLKAAITYEDIQRIETFPVPSAALREAILNALVHRDYAVPAPVQIRVYRDKLSIWNPAVLPEGWTLDHLRGPHSSRPHNPIVANAFFRAGEIEAWGRGIQRIFDACATAETPEPKLTLQGSDLWLEFPFSEAYLSAVDSGKAGDAIPDTSGKTLVKTPVKTLVKTPVKILEHLRDHPDATLEEVANAIGKSKSAVERAAAKLRDGGRLRYVGPAKGGHWEVIEKGSNS